ncbi:BspA family leucine-rich repeat surface protein [Mycoplasma mycoides]|uniref:BspA family leucine-rich repeat surface protein n=1 Tax=Mycoplasma mycoides TaxID=2102 RepID=UPI00223FD44D|nr:BspA family leucine-rich repeat surface protein [Mycoplasma mycoides]QVK08667.1 DUF285 domain-containing protein [Mycoplasma mycoides subsp. capri]
MKKLLTFLSSFGLITTSSLLVISCKNNINAARKEKDNKEKQIDSEHMPSDQPKEDKEENKQNPNDKVDKLEIKIEKIKRQATKEEKKKLETIFTNYENSFGTFHSNQDVIDQLLVYAKEQGIEDITLNKSINKNEKLKEDKKGEKINSIKLNLYATPMTFNPKKVLNNEVEEVYKGNQLIQIGYKLDSNINAIEMKTVNKKTKKVPKHLPLKINSLNEAFKNLESDKIDNLNLWNTKNIKYLTKTFNDATAFNQDINSWDVSNVIDMTEAFAGASKFNQNLNSWNTSNVREMNGVFWEAKQFNGDISKWDIKNVKDMTNMFSGAINFNQDLEQWDTSGVIDMLGTFSNATSFNGKISNWDVSNVTDMERLFQDAKSFDQDLSSWKALKVTQVANFRKGIESKLKDNKLPQFKPEIRKKLNN